VNSHVLCEEHVCACATACAVCLLHVDVPKCRRVCGA